MSTNKTHVEQFKVTLIEELPTSFSDTRKAWAKQIVEQDIPLEALASILQVKGKPSYRFLWLLADVGEVSPDKLKAFLPYLWAYRKVVSHFDYATAFATYWHICGIPEEQEGEAIDLCFQWLNAPNVKVSLKYHSMWVLKAQLKKYPELTPEYKASLEGQLELNTATFKRQATKILRML